MRIAEETWSLGVKIGLPVTIFLILLFLGVAIAFFVSSRGRNRYGRSDRIMLGCISIGCLALTIGVASWAFYPYEREYHRWYPVAGTVEQVERRILNGGNGISERVLIEIADKGEFGCDDTRCTGLKPGDLISLTCKLEWQYTGSDGYQCNYIDSEQSNEN